MGVFRDIITTAVDEPVRFKGVVIRRHAGRLNGKASLPDLRQPSVYSFIFSPCLHSWGEGACVNRQGRSTLLRITHAF
jgi:hypothetical protein